MQVTCYKNFDIKSAKFFGYKIFLFYFVVLHYFVLILEIICGLHKIKKRMHPGSLTVPYEFSCSQLLQ